MQPEESGIRQCYSLETSTVQQPAKGVGKMTPLCPQVQVRHNKFVSPRALRERNTAANALQETSEAFSVCNIQNQMKSVTAYNFGGLEKS